MRHVPLVERRTRHQLQWRLASAVCESRELELDVLGEEQRPGFGGDVLSAVDALGEDLSELLCNNKTVRRKEKQHGRRH